MQTKIHGLGFLMLLWLALTAGCIHLEQSFSIFGDGSAVILLHYSVPVEHVATLAAVQALLDQQQQRPIGNWLQSPKRATGFFQSDAVHVVDCHTYVDKGRQHTVVQCRTADIRTALGTGNFGDFKLWRNDAGNWVFEASLNDIKLSELQEKARADLNALMQNMVITLKFSPPARVLSSTASRVDGQTAMWNLTPPKNGFPAKLPEIRLVFSGAGLDWK